MDVIPGALVSGLRCQHRPEQKPSTGSATRNRLRGAGGTTASVILAWSTKPDLTLLPSRFLNEKVKPGKGPDSYTSVCIRLMQVD